jgi:predicted dithiol-disulfide oxidoreductase (DUF899 family)
MTETQRVRDEEYQWLDRAPKGRNETGRWYRLHDEYEDEAAPG